MNDPTTPKRRAPRVSAHEPIDHRDVVALCQMATRSARLPSLIEKVRRHLLSAGRGSKTFGPTAAPPDSPASHLDVLHPARSAMHVLTSSSITTVASNLHSFSLRVVSDSLGLILEDQYPHLQAAQCPTSFLRADSRPGSWRVDLRCYAACTRGCTARSMSPAWFAGPREVRNVLVVSTRIRAWCLGSAPVVTQCPP